MPRLISIALPLIFCVSTVFSQAEYHADSSTETPAPPPSPAPSSNSKLPRFGIALSVSTLGPGIQAATAITHSENVRFGLNYFDYSATFNKDNIAYSGTLNLKSGEVLFDQYLGKVFHISPGLMFYDGNGGTATANVAKGQSFSLGDATYYSDPSNPVTGNGQISARKVAPELMLGFGNLLPRSNKHFAVNFELGVVFQGSPNAKLNLNGGTCTPIGNQCLAISSNPTVQASVISEQTKINNSLAPFKYYPVIRLMFGYKF